MVLKICIATLLGSCMLQASMPTYENQITDVQILQGNRGTSLILRCSHKHPIILYAPESYQEYQDRSNITRFFMPNSVLSDGVECKNIIQNGSGLEVVMQGALKTTCISDNTIVVTVAEL